MDGNQGDGVGWPREAERLGSVRAGSGGSSAGRGEADHACPTCLNWTAFWAFAQGLGLSSKYLWHDLLPVADLPEVLRKALRQGLPLLLRHKLWA